MYPPLSPPRLLAAGLLFMLAACSGNKDQAYIEKPVDDLYNKAMDALLEENYADGREDIRRSRCSASLFSMGNKKPVDADLCQFSKRELQ